MRHSNGQSRKRFAHGADDKRGIYTIAISIRSGKQNAVLVHDDDCQNKSIEQMTENEGCFFTHDFSPICCLYFCKHIIA